MTVERRWLAVPLVALLALGGPAGAQNAPAAPPPASTAPAVPAAAPVSGLPTLIPTPGDPSDVDEVVLPEKPVVIVSGQSTWEDGLKNLRASFGRLDDEIAKTGLKAAGRPLALFVDTTDDTFRYDAMVPIEAAPTPPPSLAPGMRLGVTPSGKAYRFVHKGAYDDIDTTYETVTSYLDAKDIVAKDAFLEEYLTDTSDSGDAKLEVNIFVQPK